MSGEHAHPEIGALDTEVARLAANLARLTSQVVALEAGRADTAARLTALEGEEDVIYRYLGKPSGTLTVGGSYTDLDGSRWDPTRAGWEHTLIYLNCTPTFKTGKTRGALRVRLLRADSDTTMYHDHVITADSLSSGAQLITQVYWEMGDKTASRVQLKCIGGLAKVVVGTRYTKRAIVT
jgi:hypothetical protein